MIVVALAGPWLAMGFLFLMQRLERWLDDSLWKDVPATSRAEPSAAHRVDV